eukprot:gnl/TRDRNA2_/TRDRNA2_155017_c0_seq2.p1 gnl/TRDRNA2_/TRDRNA2_155017_c0~~gnl/TRDRNA2_/TRDRNA2_155017_c0_seq2.p1  ORF type:complete len:452 (-),score=61.33 gnl/TRDRNA2_/TRDRNA2_155017_c0_seq2:230-1585(-)
MNHHSIIRFCTAIALPSICRCLVLRAVGPSHKSLFLDPSANGTIRVTKTTLCNGSIPHKDAAVQTRSLTSAESSTLLSSRQNTTDLVPDSLHTTAPLLVKSAEKNESASRPLLSKVPSAISSPSWSDATEAAAPYDDAGVVRQPVGVGRSTLTARQSVMPMFVRGTSLLPIIMILGLLLLLLLLGSILFARTKPKGTDLSCRRLPDPLQPKLSPAAWLAENTSTAVATRHWPLLPVPQQGLHFSVPIRELVANLGQGGFNLVNSSDSHPALYVVTDKVSGRQMLGIMMMQADTVQSAPIATVGQRVLLDKEVPAVLGGLEICGPRGDLYGSLESHGFGTYTARDKLGHQLLSFKCDSAKMEISASVAKSEEVAVYASHKGGGSEKDNGDSFDISLHPGVDPVLSLLCVFAIILFFDRGVSGTAGRAAGQEESPSEALSPLTFALSLGSVVR